VEGRWVTTKQAAEILGVEPSRVRQLILSGQLPASKPGREWMLRRRDVEAFRDLPPGEPGRPRRLRRR